jgi:hypothetical protein
MSLTLLFQFFVNMLTLHFLTMDCIGGPRFQVIRHQRLDLSLRLYISRMVACIDIYCGYICFMRCHSGSTQCLDYNVLF